MPPMLDVSDEVRAEIGAEEADRLAAGVGAPGSYDCTSCRAPGNPSQERTSTVLFVGAETAVIAFAHASCIPSQVVTVPEERLRSAVAAITADESGGAAVGAPAADAAPAPAPEALTPDAAPDLPPPAVAPQPVAPPTVDLGSATVDSVAASRQAVLGITCGQLALDGRLHAALAVEPTSAIARPGSEGTDDEFLALLTEQGFGTARDLSQPPASLAGWSVLLAMGQLHAILQPGERDDHPVAWWRAHQPLAVPEAWRATAARNRAVLVYAAPAGAIGRQPREDLLREALEQAAARGVLAAASMPLAGT